VLFVLAEVALITKDAYRRPHRPSQGPLVIQRVGDIKRLGEQTLDAMVSAYFENVGQTRTLIQLLRDRSAIQRLSGEQMKEKFGQYNLELAGTADRQRPPPARAAARSSRSSPSSARARSPRSRWRPTTRQEKAAVKERELREAEARAKQQTTLTESELSISIQTNQGKADDARAQQHRQRDGGPADAAARRSSGRGRHTAPGDAAQPGRRGRAQPPRAGVEGAAVAPAPHTPLTTCSRSPRANACTVAMAMRSMFDAASGVL
jgi:uncharacterized membrane protein YqiK